MTRIDEVFIQGLAGRPDDLLLDFNSEVNVLFGLNGTGKTSLLKIMNSALSNDTSGLAGVAFESARVRFFSHEEGRSIVRTLSPSDTSKLRNSFDRTYAFDVEGRLRSPFDAGVSWKTTPKSDGRYVITYLSTSRLGADERQLQSGRVVAESPDGAFAEEIQRLWRFFTNRTLSEVTGIQQQGLARILQSLFDSKQNNEAAPLDAKTAYHRSKEFLRRQGVRTPETLASFEERYGNDQQLSTIVHEIDKVERAIERAEEPRTRLQTLVSQFFGEQKQLSFSDSGVEFRSRDQVIPLSGMSSGEKQLMKILLETINAKRSTVLIDEPELSMHIDWQRRLLSALRTVNPFAQLIVATHSPDVMADVPDKRIQRV